MAGLNNSIFDLPSTIDGLRPPEDVIKVSTRKIIPKSASKRDSFPGSEVTFDFTLSGNQHWLPSRSFVVVRDSIYVGRTIAAAPNTPDQPILADNVAASNNLQDNLWDGCELTIGGFSLGNRSKLAPQISSINKRVMKSGSYLDIQGRSAQTWDAEFGERQQDIIKAGVIPGSSTPIQGSGSIIVDAATNVLAGVGTLFLTELQPGSRILTRTNIGGAPQYLTVLAVTTDTAASLSSDVHAAQAAGTFFDILGKPSSRSNKNERIYVPPLGIFHQGKALKVW